ncbi:Ig-specific serine endopeptidase MIP [Metamycoplasma canadense]|uniref:DUF31 domain-containing protein n=1 Tax=Metamycoplasma canadense TaxID=29554 RepID=A0A077L9S8_9BACT|nr:DUF31 family protein [Metamycoplasma canadense]BAP39783.1 hypothetical protein MCAN360_0759 [Metamycoplasma canadense]
MSKNKNKKIFNFLLATNTLGFIPLIIVSCENELSKEKSFLEKNKKYLSTLLNEIKNENKNGYKSKDYIEAQNKLNDLEKLIINDQTDINDLRKNNFLLKQLIEKATKELNNYKIINETNNNKPQIDPSLIYSEQQFEDDFKKLIDVENNDIEKNFNLIFTTSFGASNKKDIFPTQLRNQFSTISIQAKQDEYNKKIEFKVIDVIIENNANITGEAKINLFFRNKATNKTKNHIFKIYGLNKNNFNIDNEGNKPDTQTSNKISNSQLKNYLQHNQKTRFNIDNEKYIKSLKSNLEFKGIKDLSSLRPSLKITNEQKEKFNKLSSFLNQDNFDNSAYKGFSLPSYKENGELNGLNIYEDDLQKMPTDIDTLDLNKNSIPEREIGLARKIVNDQYLKIAKQTFSLGLTNYKTYQKDIEENKKLIEFWKDPINNKKFNQLIEDKIEELKKDKDKLEKYWEEKIAKNTDTHLTDSLKSQKNAILKQYDDSINHYKIRKPSDEIEFLEKQIAEWTKKAQTKHEFITESGTMWILDFQINNKGYPTKWYFGTNAHVARAISKNLVGFSITKINNDINVGQNFRISELDDNITKFVFEKTDAIKTFFVATDYLKTSPKDFLTKEQAKKYNDVEEFADFAVVEIDFEKIGDNWHAISNDQPKTNDFKLIPNFNLAKEITNDYANKQDIHIKFRSKSYLYDYKSIDFTPKITKGKLLENLDNLYAVGWPGSITDFYLEPEKDYDQINRAKLGYSYSLWTNTDSKYYNARITQNESWPSSFKKEDLDRGNFLSYQIGYRSFLNKPGILDSFIVTPLIGNTLYTQDNKRYFNMFLGYMPRRWAPTGGSSGSSIRNQNNELVSIYHATNSTARVGISIAFRSEGFDYQGLYGKYNLPQYDLIYGGGENQKKSYREALIQAYPKLERTNLFKNGLKLENIPEQFKFKKKEGNQ